MQYSDDENSTDLSKTKNKLIMSPITKKQKQCQLKTQEQIIFSLQTEQFVGSLTTNESTY